jgi:hypothetical protein
MDSGLILLPDGETRVPVFFRLRGNGQSGTLSAKQARDFDTLLRLFDGDDTVILQNVRGSWKAHVHIWEPDTLADPRLASFEFTVEEQIEG